MQELELKTFIKQNSPFIYEYMNNEILKDIGAIHPSFFVRLIDEFFSKEQRSVSFEKINFDNFAYYLIVEILGEARQAFPFYRKDTLSLDELYKEVKVYYNYVRFTVEEENFCIYLVQTKAGVTAFEEEIIKFSKSFSMKNFHIENFISLNSNKTLSQEQLKIKEEIQQIL